MLINMLLIIYEYNCCIILEMYIYVCININAIKSSNRLIRI